MPSKWRSTKAVRSEALSSFMAAATWSRTSLLIAIRLFFRLCVLGPVSKLRAETPDGTHAATRLCGEAVETSKGSIERLKKSTGSCEIGRADWGKTGVEPISFDTKLFIVVCFLD